MKVAVVSIHPLNDNRIARHIKTLLSNEIEVEYVNVSKGTKFPLDYVKVHSLEMTFNTHDPISILKTWKYIKSALKKLSFDIIHVHDLYLLPAVTGIGKPVVFDRHERFEIIDSVLAKMFSLYERNKIKKLDACVYTVDGEEKYLTQIGYKNMALIPNYQSQKAFEKLEENGNRNIRTLLYIGSLSNYDRNIELTMEVFKNVLEREQNTKCILGGEICDEVIEMKVKELQERFPDRFSFLGFCKHEDVIALTLKADFGFLFFRDFPNTRYSSPNKLYEYMLGKTIFIGVGQFILEKEIVEEQAGYIYRYEVDAEVIASGIADLIHDPEKLERMKENAYTIGKRYTWESVEGRYAELYKKVLAERRK